jgi:LPXTG-motif cell wall-anchored protein
VAALAVIATLSVPTMASADEYPPTGSAAISVAGCKAQYVAEPGYFEPGETVTFTVTGVNDESISITPAAFRAKTFPGFTAAADGSLVVTVSSSAATSGQYELTTVGTQSPARGPLVFSPTPSCNAADSTALPRTGTDLSPVWLGGGMLAAGTVALGGVWLVRRKRA